MKMVKSLLLGSAAGFVAIAGAQAADLPVKARPVEYVKICSLYGEGFYFIPGTDTCLKLGGFVRVDASYNTAGSLATYVTGANARFDRADTHDDFLRARVGVSLDTRSQTEYGTLRSYLRIGGNFSTGDEYTVVGNPLYYDRAFIQFAGFTVGRTQSFFDTFNPSGPQAYNTNLIGSGTGGAGILVYAYTFQLGNGLSASIAAEDRGGKPIVNATLIPGRPATLVTMGATNLGPAGTVTAATAASNSFAIGALSAAGNAGGTFAATGSPNFPDVVGNLRLDQTWGSVGISGAGHLIESTYYGGSGASAINTGHPDSEYGYAVGGGFTLNVPFWVGDQFGFEADYAHGASQYTAFTSSGSHSYGLYNDDRVGVGYIADGVYAGTSAANGTNIELTDTWSAVAGYNHKWTKSLQTSLFGGYLHIDYNSTASARLCANSTFVGAGTTRCNPDFDVWQIGSRTLWNPVANLDIGLEVLYTHVDTASKGAVTPATGARGPGVTDDTDVVSGLLRFQRNFFP